MADFDNIELRSEKVRNIIGKVPPEIVKKGIGILSIILLLLVLAAFFVPYPESIKASAIVVGTNETGVYTDVFIPYRHIRNIKKGMAVEIEFEGYDANRYNYQKGNIQEWNNAVTVINGNIFFKAKVILDEYRPYPILKGMKGTAFILISDESIIRHIFPKMNGKRE